MQAASQVGDNMFCSLRLSLFTFMLLMGTYDILNVNVKLYLMGFLITIANKDKQYSHSKSYYDLPKNSFNFCLIYITILMSYNIIHLWKP